MTAKYGRRTSRTSSTRTCRRTWCARCAAGCSSTCASCSSAATACSARPSRPARSAWSPSTARGSAIWPRATRRRCTRGSITCWSLAKDSLEIKRKTSSGCIDNRLAPLHAALPGHAAQPLLDHRHQRRQRVIRNFTGGCRGHHHRAGRAFALRFLLTTCARAWWSSSRRPGTCTTWRRRPPRAPPTASRARTEALRDIIQAGTGTPYYTNSTQLPVGYTDDPFEALEHQEELQGKYTGGTVLHLYMAERSAARGLQEPGAPRLEKFRLPYLTITPTFSICPARLPRRRARVLPEVRRGREQ
jgi:hypothetical protein